MVEHRLDATVTDGLGHDALCAHTWQFGWLLEGAENTLIPSGCSRELRTLILSVLEGADNTRILSVTDMRRQLNTCNLRLRPGCWTNNALWSGQAHKTLHCNQTDASSDDALRKGEAAKSMHTPLP